MTLLKKSLIVFLLFHVTRSYGQYDFVDPDYQPPCGKKIHREIQPFIEHLFCWKDWEVTKTNEEKQEILSNLTGDRNPNHYFYALQEDKDTLNSISIQPGSIHVIDYDRDRDEDFIYPIWVPWAKTYNTEFWINNEGKWEFDFLIEGEIIEMGETDGKPWFIVYHKLCCSDYTSYVKKLTLSEGSQLSFQITEKFAFIDEFRRLERKIGQEIIFDQHIAVEFTNQDTLFSASGNIHHNKKIVKEQRMFNPVIVFDNASRGTLLTEIVDPNGQQWYYVMLNRNTQILKSAFQRDHRIGTLQEHKSLIQYMGWVRVSENMH